MSARVALLAVLLAGCAMGAAERQANPCIDLCRDLGMGAHRVVVEEFTGNVTQCICGGWLVGDGR